MRAGNAIVCRIIKVIFVEQVPARRCLRDTKPKTCLSSNNRDSPLAKSARSAAGSQSSYENSSRVSTVFQAPWYFPQRTTIIENDCN